MSIRWRSIPFAPVADERRRRRGSDAIRLVLASLAVLGATVAVRANLHPEFAVLRWLSPPPDGVRWPVETPRQRKMAIRTCRSPPRR